MVNQVYRSESKEADDKKGVKKDQNSKQQADLATHNTPLLAPSFSTSSAIPACHLRSDSSSSSSNPQISVVKSPATNNKTVAVAAAAGPPPRRFQPPPPPATNYPPPLPAPKKALSRKVRRRLRAQRQQEELRIAEQVRIRNYLTAVAAATAENRLREENDDSLASQSDVGQSDELGGDSIIGSILAHDYPTEDEQDREEMERDSGRLSGFYRKQDDDYNC